jgi:hypothetical protein
MLTIIVFSPVFWNTVSVLGMKADGPGAVSMEAVHEVTREERGDKGLKSAAPLHFRARAPVVSSRPL